MRYVWAMPNSDLRLGWETIRLSRRRRRGGRNWKSAESFDAGTSSSPLAHVPGLRQELWRRKENRSTSVHISLSLSLGNNTLSSCLRSSPGLPWCSSTKLERDGRGYDSRCAEILDLGWWCWGGTGCGGDYTLGGGSLGG